MKNHMITITLAVNIAAFSGHLIAMQPSSSWFSAQDKRTALIAVGATVTTWGVLEGGKTLVNHFSKKPAMPTVATEASAPLNNEVGNPVQAAIANAENEQQETTQQLVQEIGVKVLNLLAEQKTVNQTLTRLEENTLSSDAALAVHELLVGYGLLTAEGNFATEGRDSKDFLAIKNKIACITKHPEEFTSLSKQLQTLKDRVAELEKAQRVPTTATLPSIPDDTQENASHYAALSASELQEGLS